ncbi:MAG: hypothetical protein JWO82_3031 [Akkermansiaceae bacterium]|nr:hypothetical protein [Akkermansiaceae bacterium]
MALVAKASPDFQFSVEERLIGVGDSSWIVLRTEDSNMSSYYRSSRKTFLEERSRTDGKTIKSTLLLDTITHTAVDSGDSSLPAPASQETIAKDREISLADVIERCPLASPVDLDQKQFALLSASPSSGVRIRSLYLISPNYIADLFGEQLAQVDWKLAAAMEDHHAVYLRFVKEIEEVGSVSRIVCLSPALTEQVKAHLQLPEICLQAGIFDTKDEAINSAKELKKKANRPFQVWSRMGPYLKPVWMLIDSYSSDTISDNKVDSLETETDAHFIAVPSRYFEEYTAVP